MFKLIKQGIATGMIAATITSCTPKSNTNLHTPTLLEKETRLEDLFQTDHILDVNEIELCDYAPHVTRTITQLYALDAKMVDEQITQRGFFENSYSFIFDNFVKENEVWLVNPLQNTTITTGTIASDDLVHFSSIEGTHQLMDSSKFDITLEHRNTATDVEINPTSKYSLSLDYDSISNAYYLDWNIVLKNYPDKKLQSYRLENGQNVYFVLLEVDLQYSDIRNMKEDHIASNWMNNAPAQILNTRIGTIVVYEGNLIEKRKYQPLAFQGRPLQTETISHTDGTTEIMAIYDTEMPTQKVLKQAHTK